MKKHLSFSCLAPATRRDLIKMALIGALLPVGKYANATQRDIIGLAKMAGSEADMEDYLYLFSWADYTNPELVDAFTRGLGPTVQIATFDSVEAALAKLSISGATAGYDIVVLGNAYVKDAIQSGIIQKIDHNLIPNYKYIKPEFQSFEFDPQQEYSVLKDVGTIGYLYNKDVIKKEMKTWSDFIEIASAPEVSGKVAVMNDQPSVLGIPLWAENQDFNTRDPAILRNAFDVLNDKVIPHVKAFDFDPVQGLLSGEYVLGQGGNGGSRRIFEAEPDRFEWVYPAPSGVVYSDHYCIPTGAKNIRAAHAYINFMLNPDVSALESAYIGYDTGVTGVATRLPEALIGKEMILMSEEVLTRLAPQRLEGSNVDLRMDLFTQLKAHASQN